MKKILFVLAALVLALALVACGAETVDTTEPVTEAPATEHVHSYVEEIIPATCATAGKVISKCECGDIQSESETPLADHTASALNCEADTVCTVCNIVLAEKTGHSFSERQTIVEPTCTTTGKERGACIICGKIVEAEMATKAHAIDASAGWKMVDGKYVAKCTTCNQEVALGGADVVLDLTFESAITEEIAKFPAFAVNAEAVNITDDVDGDKGLFAKGGNVVYLGVTDCSALAKTGYFEISFDYTQTGKASAAETSIFTLMPGQYAATKIGGVKYGWFFKYNASLNKLEFILAGSDGSKLDATNSIAVEEGKTYKISILCAADGSAYYVFANGNYVGQTPANGVSVDFTNAKNDKAVSFRLGDSAVPNPVFDNLKIQTIK